MVRGCHVREAVVWGHDGDVGSLLARSHTFLHYCSFATAHFVHFRPLLYPHHSPPTPTTILHPPSLPRGSKCLKFSSSLLFSLYLRAPLHSASIRCALT